MKAGVPNCYPDAPAPKSYWRPHGSLQWTCEKTGMGSLSGGESGDH